MSQFKSTKRTVRVNLSRGGFCYMTPEAAKKYIADRKRISERLSHKRKKQCIEKDGEYVSVKDAKRKTMY